MTSPPFDLSDQWLAAAGPCGDVAVSSRARFARNVAGYPFAPHARPEVLRRLSDHIAEILSRCDALAGWTRIELGDLTATERAFLKESRIISKEMEQGGDHLAVYVSPDAMASILINEEDHLRLQVLAPGLQVDKVVERLREIDTALAAVLGYAWSSNYGYLTACPTNVGTGFRASAMLHLPGLTLLQEVESSLQGMAANGLTVRGFYGENSEYAGDFYQVSNEITLGRTVDQITQTLGSVIDRLIEREKEARLTLSRNHASATNDSIWRSFALLTHARQMDSIEAMRLLSRLRLGIDLGYFEPLGHEELSKLVIEIQPAHLERLRSSQGVTQTRDEARAHYLRQRLSRLASRN